MNLFLLSLFMSASFVTCIKYEENEILPPPIPLQNSHNALVPSALQGDDEPAPQSVSEIKKKIGKIRKKRGGCCPMMMPQPPSHPPSQTYVLEIKALPAQAPRPKPLPPPPPPSEYMLVPVAVVQPVAVVPAHPPPRPPRMQRRPMRHPPSTITITGTITKNEGGGCPMRPHC